MTPTFSIVVPAHGTADVVGEAIGSVLAQTDPDWQLVVVDDASPDDLAERVAPFLSDPRIELVRLPDNRGVSAARNVGIGAARGEYVVFLDSDDLLRADFLAQVRACLETVPGPGLVGAVPLTVDEDGAPTDPDFRLSTDPPATDGEEFLLHLLREPFSYRGTTVPRELATSVGGFDEALWVGEDLEFWVRVALTGVPVRVLDEQVYLLRQRQGSITRQDDRTVELGEGAHAALARIARQLPPSPARRAALREYVDRVRTGIALGRYRRAVRTGDRTAARRQALRLLRRRPSVRHAGMWVTAQLSPGVMRRLYAARRRWRGLPPVDAPPDASGGSPAPSHDVA
ncbi:glycosyltransferase family 2 protein [Actinomycetospora cinnamomea]|uniref:Glycosyl transferase family 2 n=1 Tax=Actinomycetospora cinnamomea TaxID=663609 RepID=A0A2U1F761_9PSEU|nr:glycosyltransferase family A protein [Actinomycetospora cinnamomea]PVZ07992.1 glycosyl transferase family 2 [Actinomycetospora cinnamomea]